MSATRPMGRDLICTHDLAGRILSANTAVTCALGIPAAELLRMNIQDVLDPDAMPMYDLYIDDLKRHGEARGCMTVRTRKGELRVWEYENTLRTAGASVPVVRGIASDVTERQRAQSALRKTEIRFRSIVENASDIIAIVDLKGRIGYHTPSAERDLGYPASELSGRSLTDLVHPDDVEQTSQFLLTQFGIPEANGRIDIRLRHANGAWRSFEVAAKNLVEEGLVTSTVINARDITERKQLASKLEQANRLSSLGRLAATVAHEFNNVLMGMQPFAELMQRPGVTDGAIKRGAQHIGNSIQRGKRVAMDILRFTQPATPAMAPVALRDWWDRLAPELAAQLGNTIVLAYDIPKLRVIADSSQLTQVMTNLMTNARDAMPRGGHLAVSARRVEPGARFRFGIVPQPERFVHMTVADSGSGISADVMEHVFDPLFTTKANGTGLGLAVTHQIITQHGGYVFVESEPGRGTSFHLFLTADEERDEPAVAAPSPSSDARLRTRRILIVDDEPTIVEGMTMALESLGIEVAAVLCGGEAEAAVRNFQPDLIILDVGLPDMDGLQLGRELRRSHPLLPLLFSTGHGDANRLRIPGGLTRFLYKPFPLDELTAAIHDLERELAA